MVLKGVKYPMSMVRNFLYLFEKLINNIFYLSFAELNEISQLLCIDEQILLNCLTKSGPNWSQLDNGSELDAYNATRLKYTLCRTLYGRLFTYVVGRINESLKV